MLVIKQFGPVIYAMGTLQEILAGTGIAAKVRALPNDVAGCTLEMGADGLWVGNLGTLTAAQVAALLTVNLAAGVTFQMPNPAVPSGYCPMRWSGSKITPVPGSVIAMEIGNPLATQSGGFTAGVLTRIYAGASVIPDIMLPDNSVFDFSVELGISDPSSAAVVSLMATINGSVPSGVDTNSYIVGQKGAASSFLFGSQTGPRLFRRVGDILKGGAGGASPTVNIDRSIGGFANNVTRFYAMAIPGAPTNVISLLQYSIRYVGGN